MKVYNDTVHNFVHIIEIPREELKKIDLALCKQPKETLGSFYNRQNDKPDVLINAGFFSMKTGDTIFNVIDEDNVIAASCEYKNGMGITMDHSYFQFGSFDYLLGNVSDFVTGYPVLVQNYTSCAPWTYAKEINYRAMRTMVGYNDNMVYIASVDKPGLAFDAMAELMIRIGCKYACNLDGGGSTRCMVGGKVVNTPTEDRRVDTVMAFYLTDEARDAYYGTSPDAPEYYEYTIKSGDTWWGIAERETGSGVNYPELQKYNNWPSNKALVIGETIKIPYRMNPNATPPKPTPPEPPKPITPPEPDSDKEDHSQVPQMDLKPAMQIKEVLGTFVYDTVSKKYQILDNDKNIIAEFMDGFCTKH